MGAQGMQSEERAWKRTARWMPIALFFAVVINVGIAWSIAAIAYPHWGPDLSREPKGHMILFDMGRVVRWAIDVEEDRGLSEYTISAIFNPVQEYLDYMQRVYPSTGAPSRFVPDWGSASRADVEEMLAHNLGEKEHHVWKERAVGWPALALAGRVEGRFLPLIIETDKGPENIIKRRKVSLHSGLWLPWVADEDTLDLRYLPLRPLWPGFAINTAVFAGAILLLRFGPGSLRRTVRKRRGRCPMCGYDVRRRFEAGCPECGWQRN